MFPALGVSDDQDAEPFGDHLVHNVTAGPMEIVIDLVIAFVSQSSETIRCVLSLGQESLQIRTMFVVVGIDRFQWSAVNQKRRNALLV